MKSNTFSKIIVLGRTVAFRFRKSLSRLAGRGTAGLSRQPLCSVRSDATLVWPHGRGDEGKAHGGPAEPRHRFLPSVLRMGKVLKARAPPKPLSVAQTVAPPAPGDLWDSCPLQSPGT